MNSNLSINNVPYAMAVWFLCAAVAGCNGGQLEVVPVSGQVLIDHKPLQHGTVRFTPEKGRASVGTLDEQGHFELTCYKMGDGAVLGKHRVAIVATEPISEQVTRWCAPMKYSDRSTSGLSADITGPTDALVFELSWDGGKPFDVEH